MTTRPSLIQVMKLVALLAVLLGMMKIASPWLARGVVLGSVAVLMVATLGLIVRRPRRPAWVGFALFGWVYLLLAAGGSFVVDQYQREEEYDLWLVDGAVRVLAERMYPTAVEPTDPFPNDRIIRDPITGVMSKQNNGVDTPMTPAEITLQRAFEVQTELYKVRTRSNRHCRAIGLAIQGLTVALIGAAAGNQLSDRPEPTQPPNPVA